MASGDAGVSPAVENVRVRRRPRLLKETLGT